MQDSAGQKRKNVTANGVKVDGKAIKGSKAVGSVPNARASGKAKAAPRGKEAVLATA